MNANEIQIDGTHYQTGGMQHWDFAAAVYGPGYFKGCITKYVYRWRKKGGIADLQKAAHFLQKLNEVDWVRLGWPTRGYMNTTALHDFCEAAKVGKTESFILYLITVNDFALAGITLDKLIKTALAEEANAAEPQSRGYVDQG